MILFLSVIPSVMNLPRIGRQKSQLDNKTWGIIDDDAPQTKKRRGRTHILTRDRLVPLLGHVVRHTRNDHSHHRGTLPSFVLLVNN